MSGRPLQDVRLDVAVVHGGRPDALTLEVIEQAVHRVLAAAGSDTPRAMPAWRRAARLEASGTRRISTRVGLAGDARS